MSESVIPEVKKKLIVNLLRESIIKNVMNLEITDMEKRKLLWRITESIVKDSMTLFPEYKKALIKRLEALLHQLNKI